jgi:hypothetical protein
MYGRSAFEHSPCNRRPSRARHTIPAFVFNLLRTLPFLAYNLIAFPFTACALFTKNTGGTPLRVAFLKLQRFFSSFVPDIQFTTVNRKPPLPPTPLFPPLAHVRPVSPLLATLTKMIGEGGEYYVSCGPACTDAHRATRALPRSNPSQHQLQSSFCPTCPGDNSEVSG